MKLDHVLVRTSNLGQMDRFLTEVIGLDRGPRPPFPFPGAWYYSGDQALIHVAAESGPALRDEGPLAHVALQGANYEHLMQTLRRRGVQFHETEVPVSGEHQVFVYGPDGLRVEMLFPLGQHKQPISHTTGSYRRH